MTSKPTILIVEARFYTEIADSLADGAIAAIEAAGFEYERLAVPGVFEVPGNPDGVAIFGNSLHFKDLCGVRRVGVCHSRRNQPLRLRLR